MRLKQSKCVFLTPEVVYLAHRINKEGLEPTDDKVRAVREPGSVGRLKAFLGMLSFYSKFLPKMSTALAPLYALLQKKTPWEWKNKHHQAF